MSLSVAAMDVIVDSIMVIQSRHFPEDGSEQLQAFSWNCLALGGIVASLAGGFLTQNFHPNYSFMAAAVPSVALLILSYSLPPSIERVEVESDEAPRGFVPELKQNISEIIQAIKIPVFHRVIIYLVLGGLLVPSFGSFGYYFMLDVVKISKFTIAMLGVIGYICLMIGSSLYHQFFSRTEFRKLMVYNTIIGLMFAPLNMLFVLRKNEQYGLPDMFVIIFTDVV